MKTCFSPPFLFMSPSFFSPLIFLPLLSTFPLSKFTTNKISFRGVVVLSLTLRGGVSSSSPLQDEPVPQERGQGRNKLLTKVVLLL